MTVREFIKENALKNFNAEEQDRDLDLLIRYARAYANGEEGLKQYRGRLISAEIAKKYSIDAQIAIMYNRDIEHEQYEEYQAYRAECKAIVDAKMALRKEELESALAEENNAPNETPIV